MTREDYKVFSKADIAGLKLKNRLIRSATFEAAMTDDGKITETMLTLYRRLAEGGVGLIITGHMAVMLEGKATHRQTCIHEDAFIEEIRPIVDVVHRAGNGCRVVAQLSHAGRQVMQDNNTARAVGPSAVPSPILKKQARALSTEEIETVIRAFVNAIVRVKKAGFDGAQLHAAHGWLLSSFLSPYTNRRNDEFGGPARNRAKILREIVAQARKKVGAYPLLVKMNCEDHVEGGIGFGSFSEIVREVEKAGFDAIEVSGGMWDCLARTKDELGFVPMPIPEARTRIANPGKQSYFLKYANMLNLKIPVILVGGNRNIESMERILGEGKVSFFSMARPLIKEPDLPNRWLEGRGSETAECVSCNSCLLMVKYFSLACLLNQNKVLQKMVKNLTPLTWKLLLK